MRIVHSITMELPPMFGGMFAAGRKVPSITFAEIIVMVDMTVEMFRSMKPGAGPDENPVLEPLRTVEAIRGTVIWRNLVIPVWTNRWRTDAHRYLCTCLWRSGREKACKKCG